MTDDPLAQAETLLTRLDELRERLEQTADAEQALDLLGEISELAKQAHAEIERASRDAGGR